MGRVLTPKERLVYYRNRKKIDRVILRNVKRKQHIIYGARAVNQQVRKPLRKETTDYDIYSTTPRQTANRVERRLDKRFGGDYFKVEQAIHKGTYKIKSNVDSTGYADYTKPQGKIRTIKRKGIKYAHTSHQLKQIKKSLADKESKFRHEKDKETRQRIKLNEIKTRRKPTRNLNRILPTKFNLNIFNK